MNLKFFYNDNIDAELNGCWSLNKRVTRGKIASKFRTAAEIIADYYEVRSMCSNYIRLVTKYTNGAKYYIKYNFESIYAIQESKVWQMKIIFTDGFF